MFSAKLPYSCDSDIINFLVQLWARKPRSSPPKMLNYSFKMLPLCISAVVTEMVNFPFNILLVCICPASVISQMWPSALLMSILNESKIRGCKMMDAAFSPKNKRKRNQRPPLFGTFLISIFLFEDACCFRGRVDWFLCFKTSVMYWLGPTALTHRFHHSEQKSAVKNAWISDKMQSGLSEPKSACVQSGTVILLWAQ